jgi:hypothetical protein
MKNDVGWVAARELSMPAQCTPSCHPHDFALSQTFPFLSSECKLYVSRPSVRDEQGKSFISHVTTLREEQEEARKKIKMG